MTCGVSFMTKRDNIDLSVKKPQTKAIRALPAALAKRHKVLPLQVTDGTLYVATSDPSNVIALDDIRLATGYNIRPVQADPDHIVAELTSFYGPLESIVQTSGQPEASMEPSLTADSTAFVSIGDIIASLFEQAVEYRASDIHLEPNPKGGRARFRIDGVLHPQIAFDRQIFTALITALKVNAGMDIAQRLIPQDGRLEYTVKDEPIDVRVASLPTTMGEKLVLRLLRKTDSIDDICKLRFTPGVHKNLVRFINRSGGMILATGPTGCGKTTTLYALIRSLNNIEQNIVTIEDPVEYRLPGVNQVQINPKAGLTFASGLRSILRQDPNIIMIGEIRDQETAEIAVRSALTGHLVLTTLHTNDAASAITRLLDMGVEPYLLTSALNGILSQRLVRSVCPHCSRLQRPDVQEKAVLANHGFGQLIRLRKGQGCPLCRYTGYWGRIPIAETLDATSDSIRTLVLARSTSKNIHQQAIDEGMVPLLKDGLLRASRGHTTVAEVIQATGWLAEHNDFVNQ